MYTVYIDFLEANYQNICFHFHFNYTNYIHTLAIPHEAKIQVPMFQRNTKFRIMNCTISAVASVFIARLEKLKIIPVNYKKDKVRENYSFTMNNEQN